MHKARILYKCYEQCLRNKDNYLHVSVNTYMLITITCCVLTHSVCMYVTFGDVYKIIWPWGEGVLVKRVVSFLHSKFVKEWSWHVILCEKNVLLSTFPQWQRPWIWGKLDYFAKLCFQLHHKQALKWQTMSLKVWLFKSTVLGKSTDWRNLKNLPLGG